MTEGVQRVGRAVEVQGVGRTDWCSAMGSGKWEMLGLVEGLVGRWVRVGRVIISRKCVGVEVVRGGERG